ncbi:MAG: (Fe-S)-binding protein [Hyphomicrobium sp.]
MSPHVGLFVSCLVDLMRPSIGFSAIRLLEAAGCKVSVPRQQTCCGQPAYNYGDNKTSRALALQTVRTFSLYDYIVVPSGSCAAMLKRHYLSILADSKKNTDRELETFASKTYELCTFLSEICDLREVPGRYKGRITYHDSCTGLRELGIKSSPRKLLSMVKDAELVEMEETENCCGFGGLFSETYPDISNHMVTRKVTDAAKTKARLLVGGDLGCLQNIAGKIERSSLPIECRHIAEVLAGNFSEPPISTNRNLSLVASTNA